MKTVIVIPVYNEGENIRETLTAIRREVRGEYAVAIVYDREDDTTLPVLSAVEQELKFPVRRIRNRYGRGALNAIRTGMETADSEYVIVTMADLSDPPEVMNDMIAEADRENADIVCASRYMRGGSQIGGPRLKGLLSRGAGLSLHALAGLPTHDPTNSFKLYRKRFLEKTTIESTGGFELGLELVVKAWKQGGKVTEVPTSWRDRVGGKSNFKLWKWLPHYLRWYFAALGTGVLRRAGTRWQALCAWLILLIAAGMNFCQVYRLAVDVPYCDEWDLLSGTADFGWGAAAAVHVQHRIVFTRLLFYLDYLAEGLNFRHLILFCWVLYAGLAIAVIALFRREIRSFAWFPLFFLPFFTDMVSENLLWAAQNQFHFMLLFAMLAIRFGFAAEDSLRNRLLFVFFLILSIFSMSPLMAVILLGVWYLRLGITVRRTPAGQRSPFAGKALTVGLPAAAAVLLFFFRYVPQSPELPGMSISRFLQDWLIGLGKGFCWLPWKEIPSSAVRMGFCCAFGIPAALFLYALYRRRTGILTGNAVSAALLSWSFLYCASIAAFRAGSVAPRHLEALLPAIPAFASVLLTIPERRVRRIAVWSYLVCLLAVSCFSFSFRQAENVCRERTDGLTELRSWARHPETELRIPSLYPGEFSEQARLAGRMKLSCLKTADGGGPSSARKTRPPETSGPPR